MIYQALGPESIKRCHLTSKGNPIVEIRRSYDRLISTMGFPIPVRRHLYIEWGPCISLRIPVPVEKATMFARLINPESVQNNQVILTALAHMFCYLIGCLGDVNSALVQRTGIYLDTIKASAIKVSSGERLVWTAALSGPGTHFAFAKFCWMTSHCHFEIRVLLLSHLIG